MNRNVSIAELLKPQLPTSTKKGTVLNILKSFLPDQGVMLYFILLLSLLCTVDIVVIGNWVKTPGIYSSVLISSLIPVCFARIKLHSFFIHVISLIVGMSFILYQTLTLIKDMPFLEKVSELKLRLDYWYGIATSDGISTDLIPYTITLLSLSWILGYVCSWFTFKHNNIWISIVLNGVSILTCLSFLPQEYSSRFYLYAFTVMILITQITTVKQKRDWIKNGTSFNKWDGWLTLNSAIWYSLAILVIATAIPMKIYVYRPVADAWKDARTPIAQIEEEFARLLGSVPSRTQQNGRFFGKFLPFIGSISFREEGVLTTKSDYPNYWISRTYDTYTHEGWISGETNTIDIRKNSNFDNTKGLKSTKPVKQMMQMSFPSDQFFAGGSISSVSEPVELESLKPKSFKLSIGDDIVDKSVPEDLQVFELELENFFLENPGGIKYGRYGNFLANNLPKEYKYVNTTPSENDTEIINLVREMPPNLDIVDWNLSRQIPANKKLTMVSHVSLSTPEDLKNSSQEYHGFIKDHYLDLPEEMPRRISDLAHQIASKEPTPYDKAVAIEKHLRSGNYVYSQKISTPPVGADGVDYFLFTSKAGYSDYFASAMTVMLRDLGIPSRLATGYSSGSYDSEDDISTIKDSDSHGWVQVYFPSYGWIDFEPTPNWEKPSRDLREKTPSSFIRSESIYKDGNYPKLPDDFYDELGPEGEAVTTGTTSIDILTQKSILIPLSLIFLSAVVLLFITTFWKYGLTGLSPTERITTKMYRLGKLTGISKNNYQTIEEYSLLLSTKYPIISSDIYKITNAYTIEKYSSHAPNYSDLESAWANIKSYVIKDLVMRIFQWTQKNGTYKSN